MINKMSKLLLVLCLVSLLLSSCSVDSDNTAGVNASTTRNYLKVGNVEYDLSVGVFENFGVDNENKLYQGYSTDLMLYSKGLSLQKNENEFYMFAGKGNAIYFEMFSTSGKELDSQVYVFSSRAPYEVGTFGNGVIIQDLDFDFKHFHSIEAKDKSEIVEGIVNINKNGDEYTITISCVSDNGEEITGSYKGTLPYIDWPVFDS